MMRNLLTASFLFFSICVCSGQSGSGPLQHPIDSFMKAAYKAQMFNGVVLVARHDSILYEQGWGWRDAEQKVMHDSNSLFLIGSATKSFTAALILDLQERGLLRVSDRLSKYFPDYQYGDLITIEDLLDHHSGIFEYSKDAEFMSWVTRGHLTEREFWARFGGKPLDFTPGTKFQYSNTAYMVLGYLAQKVTGRSYWDLVRQRILNRAGMVHSGFDYEGLSSPYKSVGYDSLYGAETHIAGVVDSTYSFSAGALYSTAGDLYRWCRALFDGELLQRADVEKSLHPRHEHTGYGWFVDSGMGKRVVYHEGRNFGFDVIVANIPEDKTSIILLTNNRDREAEMNLRSCYVGLLQLIYGQSYWLPRRAIALPARDLADYAGDYGLRDKKEFRGRLTLRDGRLLLSWNEVGADELFAEKKDLLFLKTYDLQLVFRRDERGVITGFSANTGGKEFVYDRVKTP